MRLSSIHGELNETVSQQMSVVREQMNRHMDAMYEQTQKQAAQMNEVTEVFLQTVKNAGWRQRLGWEPLGDQSIRVLEVIVK